MMSKDELTDNSSSNASNAVDGSLRQDADDCDNCCAAASTSNNKTSWLEIDLESYYLIEYIQILGIDGNGSQYYRK